MNIYLCLIRKPKPVKPSHPVKSFVPDVTFFYATVPQEPFSKAGQAGCGGVSSCLT